jgi:micrococcal nuclease
LDKPYPNQIFTVLIWGSDRNKFKEAPEDMYNSKMICVTGLIKDYKGKPEIIVNDPEQIKIK